MMNLAMADRMRNAIAALQEEEAAKSRQPNDGNGNPRSSSSACPPSTGHLQNQSGKAGSNVPPQ